MLLKRSDLKSVTNNPYEQSGIKPDNCLFVPYSQENRHILFRKEFPYNTNTYTKLEI